MTTSYKWFGNGESESGFLTTDLAELSSFPDTIKSHESLYKYSIEKREEFWQVIARNRLEWVQDFDQVTSGEFSDEDFALKWFINGKLNVSGMKSGQRFN